MKNINSVLINNSLKAGHSEEIFKTLELLHKIGVIPSKKPRVSKKAKEDKAKEDIKQTGDMGAGFAETKDEGGAGTGPVPSSRFPSRSVPLLGYQSGSTDSIQNITKAIEDKKAELKSLENRPFNTQQIEDIRRDTVAQLGLLTDKLEQVQSMGQYMGGALYSLGSRFGQIEDKIRQGPETVPIGISEPIDPFKNVQGAGDAVEAETGGDYEDEDIDMTNQGSQDIPENVMSVDVAPQADEVLEDEEEQMPPLEETGEVEEIPAKVEAKPDEIDKFREVERFYGFALPHGQNQSVDVIKKYVRTLANESDTKINYDKLKNREQWVAKMNELVNKQYDSIQSGDAINYNQKFQTVLNDLQLVAPTNNLNSQKTFLFVLFDKLEKKYKKSDFTAKEKVETEIKKLINEHYKTLE